MSDIKIPRKPGDLITAEDWNQLQANVIEDIGAKTDAVRGDVSSGTVTAKKAENAERFAGKAESDWNAQLDKTYVRKDQLKQSLNTYHRVFWRFKENKAEFCFKHNFGRYPIVDCFYFENQVLLYNNVIEGVAYNLIIDCGGKREWVGIPLEAMLYILEMSPCKDSQSFQDLVSEMWDKLMEKTNGIEGENSKWVIDNFNQKCGIGKLKESCQWNNLYVAFKPIQFNRDWLDDKKFSLTHINENTTLFSLSTRVTADCMFLFS